jgi:hypothetical protein
VIERTREYRERGRLGVGPGEQEGEWKGEGGREGNRDSDSINARACAFIHSLNGHRWKAFGS